MQFTQNLKKIPLSDRLLRAKISIIYDFLIWYVVIEKYIVSRNIKPIYKMLIYVNVYLLFKVK